MSNRIPRRTLLAGLSAVALAAPSLVRAEVTRNTASFTRQRWQDHFDTLGKGAILANTNERILHYWNATDTDYRVYPTSVPLSDELTKRGYTEITRKRVGPDWTPTQSQRERFGWDYMPPGPDNPLGTHAMYLSWPAYLIHGTHDTRKIGRPSSDGCIGLFNPQIEELFALTEVGTQVRVL
jgi:lipoprotein-anchoring transpeptidase ErfK/SrfK